MNKNIKRLISDSVKPFFSRYKKDELRRTRRRMCPRRDTHTHIKQYNETIQKNK